MKCLKRKINICNNNDYQYFVYLINVERSVVFPKPLISFNSFLWTQFVLYYNDSLGQNQECLICSSFIFTNFKQSNCSFDVFIALCVQCFLFSFRIHAFSVHCVLGTPRCWGYRKQYMKQILCSSQVWVKLNNK